MNSTTLRGELHEQSSNLIRVTIGVKNCVDLWPRGLVAGSTPDLRCADESPETSKQLLDGIHFLARLSVRWMPRTHNTYLAPTSAPIVIVNDSVAHTAV